MVRITCTNSRCQERGEKEKSERYELLSPHGVGTGAPGNQHPQSEKEVFFASRSFSGLLAHALRTREEATHLAAHHRLLSALDRRHGAADLGTAGGTVMDRGFAVGFQKWKSDFGKESWELR